MTKDKRLVIDSFDIPNSRLNGKSITHLLTLDELRAMSFSSSETMDLDRTTLLSSQNSNVMTVRDLFEQNRAVRFFIQIDITGITAVELLCQSITSFWYNDRVIVKARGSIGHFRKECPTVATVATSNEVYRLRFLAYVRLIGLARPKYKVVYVPGYRKGSLDLSKRFMKAVQARRLRIFTYTIEDEDRMTEMIARGVDGLVTNFPNKLIDIKKSFNNKLVAR